MITHARQQIIGRLENDSSQVYFIGVGAPVEVVQAEKVSHPELLGRELVKVRTVDGHILVVDGSGLQPFSRDETLRVLGNRMGISYNTLVKAARTGRLFTRRSGSVRLTTEAAIRYAIDKGLLSPRKSAS